MTVAEITAETASRYVETDRYRLHYYEAGSGHPIVLLHGSGPGATGWTNFIPTIGPLSSQFRVLAFDMPGWGETADLSPDEPDDHIEALRAALDALGIERAALVGNSMGGMTSIAFSIEHPERVSHLIPMGAPCPGVNVLSPGGGQSEGLRVLIETYFDPSPANFKRLVSVMAYDQAFATEELAEMRAKAALAHPEHLDRMRSVFQGQRTSRMMSFTALGEKVATITAPTMVVHGRDDRTIHFENALRLVASIQDSRLVLLNRCGHWAMLEHAAEFNRLVADFVANH